MAISALFLSACGDDITEQINANVGAVKNSDELPACTEDIAGQTAFIKETHEFLGCDGSEWQSLGASTVSVGDNVCMSKSLSDGSGFEIFCNGESIGTVRNGEKGEPGEKGADGQKGDKGDDGAPGAKGDKGDDGAKGDPGDPGKNGTNGTNGTGCEITEATDLTATIACGSETFTMDLTGYVEIPAECDATLYEDCTGPMDNVNLSGVSQKGPFVTGTDITAYELENGRSLKQTGKTFGGKIEREDGTFDINTVQLKSTFVYLVADGFYRNEVTGEKSASPIKLRALTNRQGHTNTNINLVTHLEYDRIVYLVTKKDSSVLKAKMAAEKEIFAAFGIDNTNFKGFAEDFNILEEGDGNAALLAISVLLQGDHTEAEITTLLASLSVDLGDNGEWDNRRERARIADWAMKKTFSREGLASIRKNIKSWNLHDGEPPAFEGHILNFWQNELDVGECSESNINVIKAVGNKYSVYYAQKDSVFTEDDSSLVRLICAADGESFAWRIATDLEKDVAAFAAADDGAVSRGSVDTTNIYVKEGDWRHGTELDAKFKACISANRGITDSLSGIPETVWYICDKVDDGAVPYAWREATTAEADTALFGVPGDGEPIARIGNVNKSRYYVFEDTLGNGEGCWRYGTSLDIDAGLGPCTKDKVDKVAKSSKNSWFRCVDDGITRVEGVLVSTEWREATSFERDTVGFGIPTVTTVNKAGERVYVYDMTAQKWRIGSALDTNAALGPCTESRTDSIRGTTFGTDAEFYKCIPNYTTDLNAQPVSWAKLSQAENDTLGFGYCSKEYMSRTGVDKWYTREGVRVSNEKESDLIRFNGETCEAPVSNAAINVYYGTKPDTVDGEVIESPNSARYYTYDKVLSEWVVLPAEQYELHLGGCTITRANATYAPSTEDLLYPKGEVSRKDDSSPYYLCKDEGSVRKWVLASSVRAATYNRSCSKTSPRAALKERLTTSSGYKYVCEADTIREMTTSEMWAANNADKSNARCGDLDDGEETTVQMVNQFSKFICKNNLYVWDKKEKYATTMPLSKPSGAYTAWDGSYMTIGTKVWLTKNLYADSIGASAPLIFDPSQDDIDIIKKKGAYYTFEQAQEACSKFRWAGGTFRLPTPSEYKALFQRYADKPTEMLSKDGWNSRGQDLYNLAIYSNGSVSVNPDFGNIGYYDGNRFNFVKTENWASGFGGYASLHTAYQDSVMVIDFGWFEIPYFQEDITYAGVRCISGNAEDPPISNE